MSTLLENAAHAHAWITTETVKSRMGDFEFKNSYPSAGAARDLKDALTFSRAVEAYLTHMPVASFYRVWKGVGEAGPALPNQVVLWESLMDGATLLLTGNTETVYGLCALDLKRHGPMVIEAPPSMLGGITDLWQREIAGIGLTGIDRGKGGRFLVTPPGYSEVIPKGYLIAKSDSYCAILGLRGFQVDGKPAPAVDLMKSLKVYPFAQSSAPPKTNFYDASHREVDTLFCDDSRYFDDLAWIAENEPEYRFTSHERFYLASIGIEKGKPFNPTPDRRRLLDEAAHFASAIARANSFASDDEARIVYPNRKWEWAFTGGSATWDSQGYVNADRRAAFAYIAIGMSPAMVERYIGAGSQYLWTPRDSTGAFLDGGKSYRLRIPPNIPVKNFWSVVAYDADSRSILRNSQSFPSVSSYTNPITNADGAIDIFFGPKDPTGMNWIQTTPGKGWFVLFRFYGPLEPFFNKTWVPEDIVAEPRA